jgi:drug/metabolite transporter (DMT)-like permease
MTPAALTARFAAIPAPLRGVLLCVMAAAIFAGMHNIIRFVSQTGMHPFEAAFFRNVFGLAVIIPVAIRTGPWFLRTEKLHLHLGRAAINVVAMLSWFMALSLMPVGDATAISLISPVAVAVLAMLFLGESVGPRSWIGIAVAVVGGLIVIRPGFQEVGLGVWLVLLQVVCVSNSKFIAKVLSRTDSPVTIVGYLTLLMTLLTFVPALFVWQTPTWEQLGLLAVIGLCGTTGHLLFVEAYRVADLSLVEPMMFTRMVWAALFSLLLFGEFPDLWTWIGAAVIVVGTTSLARQGLRRGASPARKQAGAAGPSQAG